MRTLDRDAFNKGVDASFASLRSTFGNQPQVQAELDRIKPVYCAIKNWSVANAVEKRELEPVFGAFEAMLAHAISEFSTSIAASSGECGVPRPSVEEIAEIFIRDLNELVVLFLRNSREQSAGYIMECN